MASNMHADLARAFRSERLIYRSPETPEDDELIMRINADSDAAISSNIDTPRPKTKKDAQEYIKYLSEKTLIGVIVCLDPEKDPEQQQQQQQQKGLEQSGTTAEPGTTATSTASTTATTTTSTTPSRPTPIGAMSLRDPYRNAHFHRQGEVGIDILAAYQGRGYGTEAIQWLLRWGFNMANLHRIRLGTFGWNQKALRVYQRVGFRLEGTEKEAMWCNGRWWDGLWLAILEDEWREKNGQEGGHH